jgi:hypothetical protein
MTYEKFSGQAQKLLRLMAHSDENIATAARRAFAQGLTMPLRR